MLTPRRPTPESSPIPLLDAITDLVTAEEEEEGWDLLKDDVKRRGTHTTVGIRLGQCVPFLNHILQFEVSSTAFRNTKMEFSDWQGMVLDFAATPTQWTSDRYKFSMYRPKHLFILACLHQLDFW